MKAVFPFSTSVSALVKSTNDKQKAFDAQHAGKKKKQANAVKQKRVPGAEVVEQVSLSSDEESNAPSQPASNVSSTRKRKISSDESDSSDIEEISVVDSSGVSSPAVIPPSKKRRVTIESDDDDDVQEVAQKTMLAAVNYGIFFSCVVEIFVNGALTL